MAIGGGDGDGVGSPVAFDVNTTAAFQPDSRADDLLIASRTTESFVTAIL